MNLFKTLFSPLSEGEQLAARNVGHFYGIDLLRGLAAIAVVIWHYQFFFQAGPLKPTEAPQDIDRTIQPLYSLLWPIYEHGHWAVQLFWMISGFVFAHIYAGRDTKLSDFALRRFARLYPLHLITLLVVAALQATSWWMVGGYQIVSRNDLYHFVLQIFMASQWGLQDGVSFNFPVWSVSIEEPIYLLFFFTALGIFARGIVRPLALVAVGAVLTHALHVETPKLFAMCVMFYYTGVCLYFLAAKLRRHLALTISTTVAGICAALLLSELRIGGRALPPYDIGFALFSPMVLLLGVIGYRPTTNLAASHFRWLGDATYSIYLWHFPVILLICIARTATGAGDLIFRSPLALAAWVATMTAIGCASFRWIERPAQHVIRRGLSATAKSPATASVERSSAASSKEQPA
ncbi:acyltransferase [Bradyrhizobium sp. U87765 SZCCT0131]|uniref:acyltransferase family protein n=1 Tax=unclassified Bradyrhizobium TaxID=2631580 RepID=UPI001BA95252|nr:MULTISPECIES: acyltransferase [unclassified Bradyrhizobium]MBR1219443.1 acyltransferase [Bradyrhizobium sp. U87765 SZCCT0131]MBR1262094.1 acyltransferase [Bradyrhizobium sp. U87765 SZCCT0134]MBR1306053.1 acyltransferase [Bradyrhizobium sp. U87765 SZCCT0110]MBR1317876.1 acyltransferase [Bradyrhizobium sp. U87765 SZCCT0109]MBR1351578.1 acyltransferase [Bradyrhizobium sp. U87765 SZCCT0048]